MADKFSIVTLLWWKGKYNEPAGTRNLPFLLIFLVIFVTGGNAQGIIHPENREGEVKIMNAKVYVYLFDQKACESTVLPAYRRFIDTSNTDWLIELLQDGMNRVKAIPQGHGILFDSGEVYEEAIEILAGKKYYAFEASEAKRNGVTTPADMKFFILNFVGPSLVEMFCLPQGNTASPRQNMSGDQLMRYLYSKSKPAHSESQSAIQLRLEWPVVLLDFVSKISGEDEAAQSNHSGQRRYCTRAWVRSRGWSIKAGTVDRRCSLLRDCQCNLLGPCKEISQRGTTSWELKGSDPDRFQGHLELRSNYQPLWISSCLRTGFMHRR